MEDNIKMKEEDQIIIPCIKIEKLLDDGAVLTVEVDRDFPVTYIQRIGYFLGDVNTFYDNIKKEFGEENCFFNEEKNVYFIRPLPYVVSLDGPFYLKYTLFDLENITFVDDFVADMIKKDPSSINKAWVNVIIGNMQTIDTMVKNVKTNGRIPVSTETCYYTAVANNNNSFKFIGNDHQISNVIHVIRYEDKSEIVIPQDVEEEFTDN